MSNSNNVHEMPDHRMQKRIACRQCDLLHRMRPLAEGSAAFCVRCGSPLYSCRRNALDRTLAMALTGLVLFVIANVCPFLAMESAGFVRETTLLTGIVELYGQEMQLLATLVLLTALLMPLAELIGLLYIFLPLKFGVRPWHLDYAWRAFSRVKNWSMMEVFMVGILVSLVKLADLATIIPGVAVYAVAALVFVLAAASASLDPQLVRDALEKK